MPSIQPKSTIFFPNPVQRSFIESQALADLFSSRVGEGKSTALAWSILHHTRHNPGANWAVVRDTWENIQKTTLKTFFEWFPPGIYGTWHGTRREFTWAEGVAKGTVSFVGMEDPSDASKLLSWELGGIAMDEPAPAMGSAGIDEFVFDIAMTRLRQPGMKWRPMKLATNNPDESHWTYKKFVSPGIDGFRVHQPSNPENAHNLPDGYYETIRKTLAARPDLIRRFVDGEYGYQAEGKAVTPQWNDKIHLANGLVAIPRRQLILLWDFGLNPTCIITQVTPLGTWNILESFVGDEIGAQELIESEVLPTIAARYHGHTFRHIGDPAGDTREQSSSLNRASLVVRKLIPGQWRAGPQKWPPRRDAIQSVLSRNIGGRGLMQVDRHRAQHVWFALRGGWHYHVARTGVVSSEAKKNEHSHPGDAMSYGAAVLFPMKLTVGGPSVPIRAPAEASYFPSGMAGAPADDPNPGRIGPATRPPLKTDEHGFIIPDHGAGIAPENPRASGPFNTLLGD